MAKQRARRTAADRPPRVGRRLLGQARPYRGRLGVLSAVSVLATPLALLVPLPLAIAIDSVIGSEPVPAFLHALLPESATRSDTAGLVVAASLVVLIALLQQLQVLATVLLGAYTGERMVLGFRTQLFEHVQRLSLAYHDSKGAIDSTYRIEYDAPAVRHIAVDGIIPLVQASLTLLGMLVVTALVGWRLALVASAVTPVLFVVSRRYGRSLRDQWRDAKQLESSAMRSSRRPCRACGW